MRRGLLGTSGTTLNIPTSKSEGEEEEQEMENLFENIMKENFPNLAKEIHFQEVQETQRVPKKMDPRKHTPRHTIITLPKIKDKERILKSAREKKRVIYKGVPITLSADFSKENLQGLEGSVQSDEKQGPTSKITLSSKTVTQNAVKNKHHMISPRSKT